MTDKEIIIDGVDVSGCGFFHPECGDYSCHIALAFPDEYTDAENTYFKCEQNPECYYKQLQTLKAENEELRKYKDVVDKLAGMQIILTNKEKMPILYENAKDLRTRRDYHSPDEVNADIDKILTITNEVKDE